MRPEGARAAGIAVTAVLAAVDLLLAAWVLVTAFVGTALAGGGLGGFVPWAVVGLVCAGVAIAAPLAFGRFARDRSLRAVAVGLLVTVALLVAPPAVLFFGHAR